jgi:hypothetical protein
VRGLGLLVLRALTPGVAFGEGVDRDQQPGAGLGGHADLEDQIALVVGPGLEGLPDLRPRLGPRIYGVVVDAPPCPAEPLGLRRRR